MSQDRFGVADSLKGEAILFSVDIWRPSNKPLTLGATKTCNIYPKCQM